MSTLDYSPEGASGRPDLFKQSVGYSIIFHFLVFFIFAVKTVFFSGEPISYESAIKVDLVAMPDKIDLAQPIAELEPAPVEKSPAPTPPPAEKAPPQPPQSTKLNPKELKKDIDRDAISLDVAKKKQVAAMEKLKQLSALEAIEKDIENDANKKKAQEKPKPIKGNVLSSGSELSGVSRLQHDNYISIVEHHIHQNWALPEWLAKKNLKAQIRVRFDENGNILSKDIYKTSGNPSFDDVVMKTIEKSAPVPAPPQKFVKILSVEGILLGFPE